VIVEWLAGLFGFLGRIAGWVLDQLPPRRSLHVRLDVRTGQLLAAFAYHGGGGSTLVSHDAVIRITNAGKTRVSVDGAGWIASDGEVLKAWGSRATLDPGDPTHELTKGIKEVIEFARAHRGIRKVYVQVAGEDEPRNYPVTNEWRAKVREAAALPTEEDW
jgi:hypothetical protein